MNTAASQLSFGAPGWLWALLLVPALAVLFVWAERQAGRRLETLIQLPRLRAQLTAGASVGRRRWRYALGLAGLAGLVLAMAEPRLGYDVQETHRRGLDLIVIVDVSKSMLATDLTPNRLTRAKLSVQDLVGQLSGDRLGLVAFAGSAFLEAPLTVAYDAVLDSAAELDTDLIPRGGTNIGGAIDLALEAFGKAEAGNRAIVLLSDGEPTSDTEQADGIAAAGRAAAAGVKVFYHRPRDDGRFADPAGPATARISSATRTASSCARVSTRTTCAPSPRRVTGFTRGSPTARRRCARWSGRG